MGRLLCVLCLSGLLIWGCDRQESSRTADFESIANKQGELGQPAPALSGMEWVKGEPVTFQDGSIYVVEFWATWCPPCRASIPHLAELQQQYKDKNVTIIGISDEKAETVKKFLADWDDKMEYTVAVDKTGRADRDYMQAFKIDGIPHAFVVDQQGKLVWQGHPMDGLDQVLPKVLDGNFDYAAFAENQAKERAEEEAKWKRLEEMLDKYFDALKDEGNSAMARALASDILKEDDAELLNGFAWTVLTGVPEEVRDRTAALQAAEKANKLTEGKDFSILDTYALALFENDRAAEAVTMQQEAMELCPDEPDLKKDLQERLSRYQAAVSGAIDI